MNNQSFIKIFQERGYFHQCTNIDSLKLLSDSKKITAYIGFDCTATSLHVGSLMQIMILRLLQKLGHKPIVIIGGGTTKIGDPTGKDEARKMLNDEDIKNNTIGIKHSLSKFIKFGEGANDALIINNADWLEKINFIEFLRDYGCHFSINRMLTFDSVKLRLDREQSLSFLEFNYMILQAFDFVELNKRFNCRLQIGGSDQWGNIINGVELNRRLGREELFGLTTPLLTTSSGTKMGKTSQGAVWLNDELLSPYDYYQFWRNTEDADVIKFLKLYTDLELEEISKLAQLKDNEINEAKKILAFEATRLCHGNEHALTAQETARKAFEEGSFGGDLPVLTIKKEVFSQGITASEILFKSGLASSGGEAKRLIRGGGAKINGLKIDSESRVINSNDILQDGTILISSGKKKHILVKLE
jgi:tyrosyl-tRNA synthetase